MQAFFPCFTRSPAGILEGLPPSGFVDDLHGLDGTFGLAIGYQQVFDPMDGITLIPFVSFAAVDAVLTRPGLLEGADLDGLLNLTGLAGTLTLSHGAAVR